MAAAPKALIALAFDFGLKRIGLATGNTLTRTAAPLQTLECRHGAIDWPNIDRLVRTHTPTHLIVGNPYNAPGREPRLTRALHEFVRALQARYPLPLLALDERNSSAEASAELAAQRASGLHRRRVARTEIDSLAATLILERWLEGEPASAWQDLLEPE